MNPDILSAWINAQLDDSFQQRDAAATRASRNDLLSGDQLAAHAEYMRLNGYIQGLEQIGHFIEALAVKRQPS